MMTIDATRATRGTRVSTSRQRADYCALVPASVQSFWAGVRLDDHITAMGPSAWSPPI